MGQTNKTYPVMEIALSCEYGGTHTNGTKERKCVGDIIAVRKPGLGIGSAEMSRYLWMWLEGLDDDAMSALDSMMIIADVIYDKRRYVIPFERIAAIVPSFNVSRALDLLDKYQPFRGVDEEPPFRFVRDSRPFNVHGLVFDKLIRRFI